MFRKSLIQKARGLHVPGGRDNQIFMQTTLCNCTHTDITAGFKTDHSMITLNLSVHSNPKGNGFWKLNMSLLSDTTFVEKIKATIPETVNEYKDKKTYQSLTIMGDDKHESASRIYEKKEKWKRTGVGNRNCVFREQQHDAIVVDPLNQNASEHIKVLKEEHEKHY